MGKLGNPDGNLTRGTAYPGAWVYCVAALMKDLAEWERLAPKQAFTVPLPGRRYRIRAGFQLTAEVFTGTFKEGIVLVGIRNPVIAWDVKDLRASSELFFPFRWFNFLESPPLRDLPLRRSGRR